MWADSRVQRIYRTLDRDPLTQTNMPPCSTSGLVRQGVYHLEAGGSLSWENINLLFDRPTAVKSVHSQE